MGSGWQAFVRDDAFYRIENDLGGKVFALPVGLPSYLAYSGMSAASGQQCHYWYPLRHPGKNMDMTSRKI
ncbi:MAG: hypothetical protein Q7R66_16835 [Undibacterium sp.]|uniref:hypothetical protein n=1 Tax=Undibacterium sp. TaxID=1914977 RepID=UPI002719BD38|nr:hypothetical protein [Undibacterium sp.]MDO8653845.1 hypothetical protein [Undibacterium sp.]